MRSGAILSVGLVLVDEGGGFFLSRRGVDLAGELALQMALMKEES